MKLAALAAVLAGSASYLQISAAPIRLLLITSSVSTNTNTGPAANNNPAFSHILEHPIPGPNQAGRVAWLQAPPAAVPSGGTKAAEHPRRPCGGGRNRFRNRVKAKTLEITNFFRAKLGLPLKEHHHHGHKHGKHHDGHEHEHHRHGPAKHPHHHHHHDKEGKHGGGAPMFIEGGPVPHHGSKFQHQAPCFGMRLHRALMSLGPWEGRAMAFVLGCGIGVLLRMFWVFAVVMIRIVRGGRTSSSQYTPVHVSMSAEDLMVPPPTYVFEDVKIPVVVEDVKAPVVVEEEVEKKTTTEEESK